MKSFWRAITNVTSSTPDKPRPFAPRRGTRRNHRSFGRQIRIPKFADRDHSLPKPIPSRRCGGESGNKRRVAEEFRAYHGASDHRVGLVVGQFRHRAAVREPFSPRHSRIDQSNWPRCTGTRPQHTGSCASRTRPWRSNPRRVRVTGGRPTEPTARWNQPERSLRRHSAGPKPDFTKRC